MSDTFDHEFDAHEQHINNEMFAAGQEPGDDDIDYETLNIVNVSHQTDKAYLVELKSGYECWLPKSKSHIHDNGLMMFVPEWLKEKIKQDEKKNSKKKMKKSKAFCKHCGNDKVEWSDIDEGWRLFNKKDGAQHVCYFEPPKGIL